MSGDKKFTDYAAEYEDCMETLDKDIPEQEEIDSKTILPKVDGRKNTGVNTLAFDEEEEEGFDETVFDMDEHWVGMPACDSEHLMPYKQLIVSFQNEDDMIAFGKLVGRKITKKTRSIWYPEREQIVNTLTRWVDEGEVNDE